MILIVDDSQENIFSLKAFLTLHDFKVDTASSGEEALKKMLQNSYFLVILDVQMPDMDGFEVAEAISGYSKLKDIPIIFLSAVNTHKKFVAKGYTSGGIDYVTKPFDPEILLLKIKTFYRLSNQTKRLLDLEKNLREEIELRKQAEVILEKKVEERTEELRKSNQKLAQSNSELQQFVFVASHDLQEPLRKIQTFGNIILERHINDKEKTQLYLEKISSSATRLRDLIKDLLNYSRSNESPDLFHSSDINIIIQETLNDLSSDDKGQNPAIAVGPIPKIEVIPLQMRQVFQNLIHNSIKFSRTDVPGKITVSAERVKEKTFDSVSDKEGSFCRIILKDNGIGFNDEHNGKIFEIFQRLNNREAYEGTGIGLAIVKKVVERHDGIIRAQGKENEGAVFTLVLPMRHGLN